MAYTGTYITSTVVNVTPVSDTVTRGLMTADADIGRRIDEAEQYVESRLVNIGYSRASLKPAGVALPLVATLMIRMSWYCITRDVFTQNRTSFGSHGSEPYTKWKEYVDEIIDQIRDGELALVDADGDIVDPSLVRAQFAVKTNTENVARADGLMPEESKSIDPESYSDDVLGNP